MVGLSTLASGSATATVGTAWLSVHSFSLTLESSRARMPVMTTRTRTMPATTPNIPSFRRETVGRCSVGMRNLRCGGFGALFLMYHTKYHGNKHQRRRRCKDQAADHGAPERGVLLAAFAEPQRHRQHSDDHGQRRHQHRPETDESGFQRRGHGITQFGIALAGKAD